LTLRQNPDPKIPALGKLTIKDDFAWSYIVSSGNIGTITLGEIRHSSCFAGVTTTRDIEGNGGPDDVLDLPDPAADINYGQPATIKSIAIKKGIVENSNIAAANILSVSLAYPQNDNDGVPFGVSADFIKSLKIKDADGTESWKDLSEPGDSMEFNDAKIRVN
jgi:hypothetical protein